MHEEQEQHGGNYNAVQVEPAYVYQQPTYPTQYAYPNQPVVQPMQVNILQPMASNMSNDESRAQRVPMIGSNPYAGVARNQRYLTPPKDESSSDSDKNVPGKNVNPYLR